MEEERREIGQYIPWIRKVDYWVTFFHRKREALVEWVLLNRNRFEIEPPAEPGGKVDTQEVYPEVIDLHRGAEEAVVF